MKTFILGIIMLGTVAVAQAQMRYFQFKTTCGHGNWQDTAYIAATDDPAVINDVYAEFAKPIDTRKFVSGKIYYGNGGYNHNADHWFLWHFIPNQWQLAEMAAEVCDGCPYSDVDADTAYWVRNIGQFCSWRGHPVMEVSKPLAVPGQTTNNHISFYPNPAANELHIDVKGQGSMPLVIHNITGSIVLSTTVKAGNAVVDISPLQNGLYFITLSDGGHLQYSRLVVEK